MHTKARKITPASLASIAALALILIAACALAQALPGPTAAPKSPDTGVVINEVMTKNTQTLEDDFGAYPDWIELANTGSKRIDLSGWMLMGSKDADAAFVFSGEAIDPGQTLLVFASGRSQTRSGYVYHAPFKLSASGDTVSLYDKSGLLISRLEVPALEADTAWARSDDGAFAAASPATPGLPNASVIAAATQVSAPPSGAVRLNELMASNATYQLPDGCVCDYVELYNDGSAAQPLDGYALSDDEQEPSKYPLDGLSIPAKGCLLIHLDGLGEAPAHAPFALSSKGEPVILSWQGQPVDSVSPDAMAADHALSFSRGSWTALLPPTPGLENTAEAAALIAAQFEEARRSSLLINEVCFSTTARTDGLNSFDWLELRNTGAQPVDLAGYGLSDNPAKPRKWQFPEGASIPAGGYLTVMFAEGDAAAPDSRGHYRTGFGLSVGESVTLCAPDGTVIDRVPVMKQYGDISCGRMDGESGFFYFQSSTMGAYNGTGGVRTRCEKPAFSVSGGLYGAGETLTVSLSADPDALIFYTLDCTEPTTSSAVYSGPITVSGNTVIRAIATRRGSIDSYVATETYLFGLNHGLRVVSLVSAPDNLYSSKNGIIANQLKKWERAANVEIYGPDGSVIQPSHGCGIALNGDASRRLDMKSFRVLGRLTYDESNSFTSELFTGRDYENYRSFLLRAGGQDNTRALIRDPFIDSLASATEVMYQESEMCVLYLNGEFYGVYDIRERISTYSICDFEGWARTKRIDIIKGNDLTQNGSNSDYADLLSWIKQNPTPTDENIAYVATRIDLNNYLDYMCFMIYSANQDVGVRRYRPQDGDGKWRWIVFDQDFGFYNDTDSISRWMDPAGAGSRKTVENKLFRYLMGNDAVVERFLTRFGELLAGPWAPDELLPQFDALVDSIRPEMTQHCQKWASTLTLRRWEEHITSMRGRIEERAGKIIGYLSDYFKLSAADRERYFGAALKRLGET